MRVNIPRLKSNFQNKVNYSMEVIGIQGLINRLENVNDSKVRRSVASHVNSCHLLATVFFNPRPSCDISFDLDSPPRPVVTVQTRRWRLQKLPNMIPSCYCDNP